MTLYAISEVTDNDQIHAFLANDINYAAYAIGDLEPPYSADAHWYAASQSGAIEGMALVYSALEPQVLFLMGDIPALGALLIHGIGPDNVFFTARPDVEPLLSGVYHIEHFYSMFRMRVNKGLFKPLDTTTRPSDEPIHIDVSHATQIDTLIREAASADDRDLRDVAFSAEMLNDGYYRGIFRDNQLVAMAGTHMTAPQARMAAVGNVITHPNFRRQGLGSIVSQAVTESLIKDDFELIVLNVRQNNQGALKIYRKLGYKQVCPYIEGVAMRR